MTSAEMKAFARALVDGGPVKKSEVLAFLRAYLDEPAVDKPQSAASLYIDIQTTDSGIHVPREVNRSYTWSEGAALVAMLTEALRRR